MQFYTSYFGSHHSIELNVNGQCKAEHTIYFTYYVLKTKQTEESYFRGMQL